MAKRALIYLTHERMLVLSLSMNNKPTTALDAIGYLADEPVHIGRVEEH